MLKINTKPLYTPKKQDPFHIPDHLVFQAVQCAENYSEWDVRMMYSALSNLERKLLKKYLKQMLLEKTNDRIVRAIAILQDLADTRER